MNNHLTPAQAERLAMLAEEAGEIVQAVGKILRHGYGEHHPDDPEHNNQENLESEVEDLLGVTVIMLLLGDMSPDKDPNRLAEVIRRKLRYTHHQPSGDEVCDLIQHLLHEMLPGEMFHNFVFRFSIWQN